MMTPHQTKICLLLFTFTFFWSWQIAQPVLDRYLPSVSIGHTNLTLPISEVTSQYLGAATLLSAYTLYSSISYGELSFLMNVAFLSTAFMVASGHGIHVACVTIQNQMTTQTSLYKLVYFLHEHYSHNTFLIGFYCLVYLLIYAERKSSKRPKALMPHPKLSRTRQKSSNGCNNRGMPTHEFTTSYCTCCPCTRPSIAQECEQLSTLSTVHEPPDKVTLWTIDDTDHRIGTNGDRIDINISNNLITSHTLPPLKHKLHSVAGGTSAKLPMDAETTAQRMEIGTLSARCVVLWTTRVWPVFVGVYFSVFASMTSTKPLTTLFYFGVLSSQMTLYNKLPFNGLSDFLKLWDSHMVIGGFFTKAVLIGLPLMLLDFE